LKIEAIWAETVDCDGIFRAALPKLLGGAAYFAISLTGRSEFLWRFGTGI
jgi:hypothetical protein